MTLAETTDPDLIRLPVQAPIADTSALIARLATQFGATWVDETTVAAWAAGGGDRVVLLAGEPVRFPEGLDVAVVLPELRRSASSPFEIAVVPRAHEDAVARRYGSQRWPTLLFLRDGQYVTALSGMHDWDVFVARVDEALAMPVSRAPTIGIPLVNAGAATGAADDASCH
jgi:hydrogenase-1 operon protein HyaE